jgi:16S rRNA U516 pseudouridylate synthase RsuA-like enzyme
MILPITPDRDNGTDLGKTDSLRKKIAEKKIARVKNCVGKERIAKFLARAGVASRRESERMIEAGRVALNGALVSHPATLVETGDALAVDGQVVATLEQSKIWRYHKPAGLVTTARDPQGRPTVFAALDRKSVV